MQPARRQKTARQALEALMRLSSRAEKSSGDARRLMRGWGIAAAESEKILAELIDSNFIDDQRFATAYTREKIRTSGWGPRKIAAALAAKGVARETIDRTVREQFALAEQAEHAERAGQAKRAEYTERSERAELAAQIDREHEADAPDSGSIVFDFEAGPLSPGDGSSGPKIYTSDNEARTLDFGADPYDLGIVPVGRLEKYLFRRLPRIKAATSYELRSKLTRYALSLGYDYDDVAEAVSKTIAVARKTTDIQ